jgi:hypothetical protein
LHVLPAPAATTLCLADLTADEDRLHPWLC